MEENKKSKNIKENEASALRWIVAIVVGYLLGTLIGFIPIGVLFIMQSSVPALSVGGSWHAFSSYISLIINFACMFIGTVISIKLIAKTSFKSYVMGADHTTKVNVKNELLPITCLYVLGLIVATVLPNIKNISLNNLTIGQVVFVIFFTLAFAWMQTSWEELVFRGIPLRITCHNDIRFNKKSVIGCIISSLLFMAVHITNPEVQTLSGIDMIFMILAYLVPGVLLYVIDVMCGNLLPGLIIHFVNNFFAFVIVSAEVSVVESTSIWIDYSKQSGFTSMITVILAYVPVLIYLIVTKSKKS